MITAALLLGLTLSVPHSAAGADEAHLLALPAGDSAHSCADDAGVARAVAALTAQAARAGAAGDGERAVAVLERALAIAPLDPWVWHRLAVLRLQQGEYASAEALAGRSLALATEARLLGGNWRVIALARERRGDTQGARSARESARLYESTE